MHPTKIKKNIVSTAYRTGQALELKLNLSTVCVQGLLTDSVQL
jgi:hypothetical protein